MAVTEFTAERLDELQAELNRLRSLQNEVEKSDKETRNQRRQSAAEKAYREKHIRIELEKKYRAKYEAELNAKIEAAVQKELDDINAGNEPKEDHSAKIAALEKQAKKLVEESEKPTQKRGRKPKNTSQKTDEK